MKVLLFFLRYWRSSDSARGRYTWGFFVLLFVFGILTGFANTALLGITNTALNSPAPYPSLWVWGFVGLCVLMPIARLTSETLMNYFLVQVLYDMHVGFCRRILSTPLRRLEEIGAPELTAVLGDDIRTISQAFRSFVTICVHGTIIVTSLVYLGWLSLPLLLGVLGFLTLSMLIYLFFVRRGQHFLGIGRTAYGELFQHFRALTQGNKELKLHRQRREAFFSELLAPTLAVFRQNVQRGNIYYTLAKGWSQTLYFVLIGIVLFGLSSWSGANKEILTGYTLVMLFLISPLEAIVNELVILDRTGVSVRRIEDLGISLAGPSGAETLALPAPAPTPTWQRLELRELTHSYAVERQKHPFRLGPLSLTFTPGEIIFLVGGNGSGKTTLAKLLVGLYTAEGGEILLDGVPITDANRDEYRQLFSALFVDFFLFDKLLGMKSQDLDGKAREYLARLELDHKVEIDRGRLSTTDLSQGQRKRLALLTAYLEDRPFYLFDEWAANQDPAFRTVFYTQLVPDLKARGKTVLVITHDDHYFSVADRLIKLDYGQLEYDSATMGGLDAARLASLTLDGPTATPVVRSTPTPDQSNA